MTDRGFAACKVQKAEVWGVECERMHEEVTRATQEKLKETTWERTMYPMR